MKRTLFIILAVIAVFLIIGFSFTWLAAPKVGRTFSAISNELPADSRSFGYGGGEAPAAQPLAPAMDSSATGAVDTYNPSQPAQAQERLVIENADLAIVVKDPKARMAEISKLATDMGGYVVSSNLYQSYTPAGKE